MATAAVTSMTPDQVRRRSLYSGTIGAIVEWYEYTVYATAAALVFGPLFFPAMEPGISQIAALATFGWASSPGPSAPSWPGTSATGSGARPP
ncbi:hypothetical protein [Kocuria sp. KH4]